MKIKVMSIKAGVWREGVLNDMEFGNEFTHVLKLFIYF